MHFDNKNRDITLQVVKELTSIQTKKKELNLN